jgi:hypothetical protein
MAEIKSTLDLVLERTGHLSLSAEEKAQQKREDFEKRLQGLLLQYEENTITLESLRQRIAAMEAELKIDRGQHLLWAVFKRIDPGEDNQCWLDLVAHVAPAVHDPLQKILSTYHNARADLAQSSDQRLRKHLAERNGIKGSAVIPNPEQDTRYAEGLSVLRTETFSKMDALLKR